MSFNMPLWQPKKLQLGEFSGFVEGGVGWGQDISLADSTDSHANKAKKLLSKFFKINAGFVADASIFGEFGLKTFDPKLEYMLKNYCFYATLGVKLRFGAWLMFGS